MGYRRPTPSKKDDNHDDVVKMFISCGWSVLDVHELKNCCDIIVSRAYQTVAIEIKDGSKPRSKRLLTTGEKKFKSRWGGMYAVIETEKDVMDLTEEMFSVKIANR